MLFQNKQHKALSHVNPKNKLLAPLQKGAIMRSLVTNSYATSKQIWQTTISLLDERNILVSHFVRTVSRAACAHCDKQRNRILQKQMDGIEMSGKPARHSRSDLERIVQGVNVTRSIQKTQR